MLVRVVRASGLAWFVLAGAGDAARADTPGGQRRLEQVWVDPVRDVAPDARQVSAISNILFINRCAGGCVLTPGSNDARRNTSSIIDSTTTISEFALGDEVFNQVIDCVRDVYGPYDVEVVTEDPGEDVFHHEAILAGTPQELGLDPRVGGIAPAACDPLNNVISFSFANVSDIDAETLCWTVAQESAHSFGLPNHVYDCLDPMTYLEGPCGRKYFRNRAIPCGEFEPKSCICGVNAQNSHLELLATFGAGTPPPAPEVTVLYPDANSSVQDHFSVFFSALDPRLVDHVDVYFNGTRFQTVPGHNYQNREEEYNVEAPDYPDGYIDVELRAYNGINEAAGTAEITVLKGAPCTSSDQCFDFMECKGGRCAYPAASGELGDDCEYDQYCLSGACARKGDSGYCSQGCNPSVTGACPIGFECLEQGLCWPEGADGGGGCCAVAGGQGKDDTFPLALLSLFAGAIVALRWRRRAA
jgi:hypothetical protein